MKLFLSTLFICAFSNIVFAQSYDLAYGSKNLGDPPDALFYADVCGQKFTQSSGIIAVGYFNEGFDLYAHVASIDSTGIDPILESFNTLHSTGHDGQLPDGYITGSTTLPGTGAGKTPYIISLSGITSLSMATEATGIGIFTDSSFEPIPVGSDVLPITYDLTKLRYDTLVIGEERINLLPVDGYTYLTHSLLHPHPPLETSQQLSDNWWYSDWFGVFYSSDDNNWLYHETIGWVYLKCAPSRGMWLWETATSQWLYTHQSCFPLLWSEKSQTWHFPRDGSNFDAFWYWDTVNQTWVLP